ncbi:NAD-dependent epimerase/dehydratase family protein [Vagococcus sp. WN89Y]|uniref:NAD-dependent epimerase/dehydratase family protein n=1 Tax=Vagococcus sp. WN89Y TaxID=3457258 RepID=UPI003FCDA772
MQNVLITGGTGLVGSHLLRLLANDPRIATIAAPTRRPLRDFSDVYNPYNIKLTDALAHVTDPVDTVFCCLGTTLREAGSKEAFVHADFTLVVDTALAGQRLGAKQMLVVSSMGANARSLFFYNRVKGKMEEALIAQQWPSLTIVRPSMLLGERENTALTNRFLRRFFACCPVTGKRLRRRMLRAL